MGRGGGAGGSSNSCVHPSPNRHATVGFFIRAIACSIFPPSHAAVGAYPRHSRCRVLYHRVLTFPCGQPFRTATTLITIPLIFLHLLHGMLLYATGRIFLLFFFSNHLFRLAAEGELAETDAEKITLFAVLLVLHSKCTLRLRVRSLPFSYIMIYFSGVFLGHDTLQFTSPASREQRPSES